MRNLFLYITIICFALVSFACNNKKSDEIPKTIDSVTNNQIPIISGNVLSDSIKKEKDENKVPKQISNAKPTNPKDLVEFLPVIRGAEKLPPNTGTQSYDSKFWTSVSTDYRFKGGTGVTITINDYFEKSNFPTGELEYFQKTPVEKGYIITDIKNEYGKGFIQMDLTNENGFIFFLVKERFTIKVEGFNLPKSMNINNFFNLINFKKLSNLK